MADYAHQLVYSVSHLTKKITFHPLYENLSSISDLQIFMEQHVFAVWDFMCLLKELHRHIVTTSSPWLPPKDPLSAYLIGSILSEEEGDLTEDGVTYKSHYEIYIDAMRKIGATTFSIESLHRSLQNGLSIQRSLEQTMTLPETKQFVLTTFSFFDQEAHQLAAAFVYGREAITANMFAPIIDKLEKEESTGSFSNLDTLIFYLKRHVELDGNEHLPKALRMMENLIDNDEKKFQEAKQAALTALSARINFLDGVYNLVQKNKSMRPFITYSTRRPIDSSIQLVGCA